MSWNRRKTMIALMILAGCALSIISVWGAVNGEAALSTDFGRKNLAPCWQYPFGTDWMGRDMFQRTLAGLSMSVRLGVVTATISALIALTLGAAAATMGRAADAVITWLIDLVMGVPHMLLLILIAFSMGKGFWGVAIGIIFTHWMSLARLMRAEIMQLRQAGYVKVAERLGASRFRIVVRHMLPHLLPQFVVGLILLFPHAILHEASITFLGFGLPPEQPAIGVILSESMRYLVTGSWWLALCPGLCLLGVVCIFDSIGNTLRKLLDPASSNE